MSAQASFHIWCFWPPESLCTRACLPAGATVAGYLLDSTKTAAVNAAQGSWKITDTAAALEGGEYGRSRSSPWAPLWPRSTDSVASRRLFPIKPGALASPWRLPLSHMYTELSAGGPECRLAGGCLQRHAPRLR